MKQANELMDQLLRPFGGRSERHRFFERIKSMLPQTVVDEIAFMYIKNRTLFIVVKNSAMVFEINYKLNCVKPALIAYAAAHPQGLEEPFDSIKAFATNFAPPPPPPQISKFFKIPEKSKGEFVNALTDDKMQKTVESIRAVILKKVQEWNI